MREPCNSESSPETNSPNPKPRQPFRSATLLSHSGACGGKTPSKHVHLALPGAGPAEHLFRLVFCGRHSRAISATNSVLPSHCLSKMWRAERAISQPNSLSGIHLHWCRTNSAARRLPVVRASRRRQTDVVVFVSHSRYDKPIL